MTTLCAIGSAAGILLGQAPFDSLETNLRKEKENDMDWNAIFFSIALPAFIIGAIGLGVYVHRLPG